MGKVRKKNAMEPWMGLEVKDQHQRRSNSSALTVQKQASWLQQFRERLNIEIESERERDGDSDRVRLRVRERN